MFLRKHNGFGYTQVTNQGVEVEGAGLVKYDNPMYARATALCGKHAQAFADSSVTYQVPAELLMACTLTESAAKNPEYSVREEPGYLSDDQTPARISAGICQLLISTARSIMKDPHIDRAWLFNPANSINACAAYIKFNRDSKGTDWDPIYAACAYNAGGLYENQGEANRWKLRQSLTFHSSLCFHIIGETQRGSPPAGKAGREPSCCRRDLARFLIAAHHSSQDRLREMRERRRASHLGADGRLSWRPHQTVQPPPGDEAAGGALAEELPEVESHAGRDLRTEPRSDPARRVGPFFVLYYFHLYR